MKHRFLSLVLLGAAATCAVCQQPSTPAPAPTPRRPHLADYDAELRRADGRVDLDAMLGRLRELGVTTYYWLVWHAPTDWEDLKLFLPRARAADIDVWVYLVPPSEGPPGQPFGLDFVRWAEEIARLSLQHTNLTGWVIDDFYANRQTLTPAYLGQVQSRAKGLNPRLAFLPLMYFNEMTPAFVRDYRPVIDGVVVAYLQDREELDRTWSVLNDAGAAPASDLSFPPNTPSRAGDFGLASQSAAVLPGEKYVIRFRERDDFTGPTAGYHFKQLLVDGQVAWEADVAGGPAGWREVSADVTAAVRGRTNVTVAFRLLDKKGVGNFGVRWQLANLEADNLRFAADFRQPQDWKTNAQGRFATGFGQPATPGERRFHVPFISMTAGDASEFKLRHGDPASPERIAAWLRVSLQAWREGRCDGVVTYCLDKRPQSATFPLAQKLFREFR